MIETERTAVAEVLESFKACVEAIAAVEDVKVQSTLASALAELVKALTSKD